MELDASFFNADSFYEFLWGLSAERLADYNRRIIYVVTSQFCEMRSTYRSMGCAKDKEIFEDYCLKAEKNRKVEEAKVAEVCIEVQMHIKGRATDQYWCDEDVIQWIMSGGASPRAHRASVEGEGNEEEGILQEVQGVLDGVVNMVDKGKR